MSSYPNSNPLFEASQAPDPSLQRSGRKSNRQPAPQRVEPISEVSHSDVAEQPLAKTLTYSQANPNDLLNDLFREANFSNQEFGQGNGQYLALAPPSASPAFNSQPRPQAPLRTEPLGPHSSSHSSYSFQAQLQPQPYHQPYSHSQPAAQPHTQPQRTSQWSFPKRTPTQRFDEILPPDHPPFTSPSSQSPVFTHNPKPINQTSPLRQFQAAVVPNSSGASQAKPLIGNRGGLGFVSPRAQIYSVPAPLSPPVPPPPVEPSHSKPPHVEYDEFHEISWSALPKTEAPSELKMGSMDVTYSPLDDPLGSDFFQVSSQPHPMEQSLMIALDNVLDSASEIGARNSSFSTPQTNASLYTSASTPSTTKVANNPPNYASNLMLNPEDSLVDALLLVEQASQETHLKATQNQRQSQGRVTSLGAPIAIIQESHLSDQSIQDALDFAAMTSEEMHNRALVQEQARHRESEAKKERERLAELQARREEEARIRAEIELPPEDPITDAEAQALGWANAQAYKQAMEKKVRKQQIAEQTLLKMDSAGQWCSEILEKLAKTVEENDEDSLSSNIRTLVEAAKQFSALCAIDEQHQEDMDALLARVAKLGQLAKKVVTDDRSLKPNYLKISKTIQNEQQRIWKSSLKRYRELEDL